MSTQIALNAVRQNARSPLRRAARSFYWYGMIGLGVGLLALACAAREESPDDLLRIDYAVIEWPTDLGFATLDFRLCDARGNRVTLARVDVEANMAHPGMVPERVQASEVEAGRYRAVLALGMRGDWFMLVEVALSDGRRVERVLPLPRVGRA